MQSNGNRAGTFSLRWALAGQDQRGDPRIPVRKGDSVRLAGTSGGDRFSAIIEDVSFRWLTLRVGAGADYQVGDQVLIGVGTKALAAVVLYIKADGDGQRIGVRWARAKPPRGEMHT